MRLGLFKLKHFFTLIFLLELTNILFIIMCMKKSNLIFFLVCFLTLHVPCTHGFGLQSSILVAQEGPVYPETQLQVNESIPSYSVSRVT